jgi:hypothetical protein
MDGRQEHVSVVVDESQFSLTAHLDLVQLHVHNFARVGHLVVGLLSTDNVENSNSLWVGWVDDGQHI